MKWRPIETAPKDGTRVWAYNGEQGVMKWLSVEDVELWIWEEELRCDVDPDPEQPTHWMPLPDAPNEDNTE